MHVKPLNQIGLALTITNYMDILGKNKKKEFEQIKPRNLRVFFNLKTRNPNKNQSL